MEMESIYREGAHIDGMELSLSLGADHQHDSGKGKMLSDVIRRAAGQRGEASSAVGLIRSADDEDDDQLSLRLPLLGGRRDGWEVEVTEQTDKEADAGIGMVVATARKKMKLSKEQSSFLEQSFIQHQTLGSSEKVAIAELLSLHPRQVEVWFQNRRARTKLKKVEEDCAYLRRQCKSLTEENMRLQRDLSQIRASLVKAFPAGVHPPPSTALTLRLLSCRCSLEDDFTVAASTSSAAAHHDIS
ncbi:hypothetical protein SAY86_015230 [Trapa natans]|uniref:Homeobox domain-containing protein n=1 Tax=Trapa natans TaxID=22666 RepID=A0AAN7QK75_TRANT|nr:hypothetical protein SAY86_015230 [Trapa natans]